MYRRHRVSGFKGSMRCARSKVQGVQLAKGKGQLAKERQAQKFNGSMRCARSKVQGVQLAKGKGQLAKERQAQKFNGSMRCAFRVSGLQGYRV